MFVILYANCCVNCYYNFNLCGIFENMTSFSFTIDIADGKRHIQGKMRPREWKVGEYDVLLDMYDVFVLKNGFRSV